MKRTTLAALAIVLIAGSAPAGWWDGVADAEPVDLSEVVENPFDYKGKEITFTCVFHQVTEFYNPYYTQFVPTVYVNFAVWPAGTQLWNRDEYRVSHPFCFLERDHKALPALLTMKRFTRLKLTGYVESTFKGVPWIEIRHLEVLPEAMTKDTLKQVVLGDRAAGEGDWTEALGHYRAAAQQQVSPDVALSIAKKRGRALLETGRRAEAKAVVLEALERGARDQEALELLAEITEPLTPVLPEQPQQPELVESDRYPEEQPAAMPPPVDAESPAWLPPARPAAQPAAEPTAEPAVEPAPKPEQVPVPKKRMSGPM